MLWTNMYWHRWIPHINQDPRFKCADGHFVLCCGCLLVCHLWRGCTLLEPREHFALLESPTDPVQYRHRETELCNKYKHTESFAYNQFGFSRDNSANANCHRTQVGYYSSNCEAHKHSLLSKQTAFNSILPKMASLNFHSKPVYK